MGFDYLILTKFCDFSHFAKTLQNLIFAKKKKRAGKLKS